MFFSSFFSSREREREIRESKQEGEGCWVDETDLDSRRGPDDGGEATPASATSNCAAREEEAAAAAGEASARWRETTPPKDPTGLLFENPFFPFFFPPPLFTYPEIRNVCVIQVCDVMFVFLLAGC